MSTAGVEKVREELQVALEEGWRAFQESDQARVLERFLLFLMDSGFYESEFRNVIANPAYDNAAKLIGRSFLRKARELGLQFDDLFPGDFLASEEEEAGDHEIRRFRLQAFRGNEPYCSFVITFPHRHDRLEFPGPPLLELASPRGKE